VKPALAFGLSKSGIDYKSMDGEPAKIFFLIAIPHGKDNTVVKPALAFGLSKSGIDYKSMDGEPAKIFFLIAVPEKSDNMHLQILSTISRKLMHEEVREKLYNSKTYEDILKAFES
jgi:PTS system nitrogen regulatory IIA component